MHDKPNATGDAVADTVSPDDAPRGADPEDVRTDIGASDGAVPASYGAGGYLQDSTQATQ